MKRIFGLRGVAAAALALSSVALFSTSIEGSSASAASSTFVIGTVNSVQKIDPDIVTNFLDFEALGLIYNTLVQENANLQIVPDLATSWAFSNGNKTLTLQLRQGVKFDDGSTMTSADVVASLTRAQATATADPSASFIGSVTNIAREWSQHRRPDDESPRRLGARRTRHRQHGHHAGVRHNGRHHCHDARRYGTLRVLGLGSEHVLYDDGQPELLGWQAVALHG